MNAEDAKVGNIVEVTDLMEFPDLFVSPEHEAARRPGARGRIQSRTLQHEGYLLWVKHGRKIAPYWLRELTLVGEKVATDE